MLFLDGVGIGKNDPSINPFFAARLPALRSLSNGELPSLRSRSLSSRNAAILPLDATLGVEGLPQSGTGQTALFTGVNASKFIGKHFGPRPYSTLRPVIAEKNIFQQLLNLKRKVLFANAFPQRFFDYVDQKTSRLTVTTLSCTTSGLPLLQVDDLAAGCAVSADITNTSWPELGYPHIATIEPAEAGRRLVRLTESNDFVLFEYWKTDYAGHSQKMSEAIEALELLDGMLVGIIETLDTSTTLLCITSDHGNIEDMSTKSHTRNAVPAILYGYRHQDAAELLRDGSLRKSVSSLTNFTPMLIEMLSN